MGPPQTWLMVWLVCTLRPLKYIVSIAFSTRFPFGFTERHTQVTLQRDVLVYPCLAARQEFDDILREIRGEIAARLGLAESTIHSYVASIFRKFGVRGRKGLMSLWLQHQQTQEAAPPAAMPAGLR